MPMRARVKNGRLTLDEPTDLPEGTEVEVALARHRKMTRSATVREATEALEGSRKASVASTARDLAGSLRGPRDLSTSDVHMADYGE